MKKLFATAIPGALLMLASASAVQAQATSTGAGQAYPAKTVRVICPWPAGGLIDVVGRIVLQKMSENTGQQFIVDNRAGAIGVIGADMVARAPADGYTRMVHSASHISSPHIVKKLPYDPLKDFVKRLAAIQLHYSHGNAIIKV
jgi:tripartite-type tricarboxylate transporter receptor subunit TctC